MKNEYKELCKGVRARKNNNGWSVLEIHYSADTRKDPDTPEGKLWKETESEGYSEKAWAQEYEIDASALGSTRVFPQFDENQHCAWFNVDPNWTVYQGNDSGIDSECAGLWLGVDENEHLWVFHEYYRNNLDISTNVKNMLSIEEAMITRVPTCRFIDPTCINRLKTGVSEIQEYAKAGMICIPANNDRNVSIDAIRKLFLDNRITIHNSCTNLKMELIKLLYNKKCTGTVGKDHLIDCLRYIVIAGPQYIKDERTKKRVRRISRKIKGVTRHLLLREEDE